MKWAILLCATFGLVYGRTGFGPGEQDWGYVTVRPEAHMFWWLFYTTADVNSYTDRPLVIWLQGGPGASSTGYGNFAELGPLDLDLNNRNHTWVKDVNVLFIDNPVGTGFSYVQSSSVLTTTNREIAIDLVEGLRGFYQHAPEFESVPLYILSESYGGKMTAEFALVLDQEINAGTINSNFIGAGLGDSWVSPIDSVLNWAPYLWNVGAVDRDGYAQIDSAAQLTKSLLDAGRYAESTSQWGTTEYVIMRVAHNIDFYNILKPIRSGRSLNEYLKSGEPIAKPSGKETRDEEDDKLAVIMPLVREALGLNVTWGAQSNAVFSTLRVDFMKPATEIVELVLNTTDVKVAVFNGQLDLIVCTPGTVDWVDNLTWTGTNEWATASRPPISVNGIIEGYEKVAGNLAFYWVNRAGHMVPSDNPAAMDYILRNLTNNYDGTVTRRSVVSWTTLTVLKILQSPEVQSVMEKSCHRVFVFQHPCDSCMDTTLGIDPRYCITAGRFLLLSLKPVAIAARHSEALKKFVVIVDETLAETEKRDVFGARKPKTIKWTTRKPSN